MGVESGHQSQSSFTCVVEGRRFFREVFTEWYSGWSCQSGFRRKSTGVFSKSKRVVERSPTKSASSDFRLIVGRVGLQISVPPGVSCQLSNLCSEESSFVEWDVGWDELFSEVPCVTIEDSRSRG